ncbi:hypothetical protein U1Q18_046161 [Sarracenia purpurea var. burkii]
MIFGMFRAPGVYWVVMRKPLSTSACILTLKGHTNEKIHNSLENFYRADKVVVVVVITCIFNLLPQNFVGLLVADGYIACGSKTNEVCAYYRSLPIPITAYKFGSVDPTSSKEIDDDSGQFVSSVCRRKNSDMLVAANSSGCIKVL